MAAGLLQRRGSTAGSHKALAGVGESLQCRDGFVAVLIFGLSWAPWSTPCNVVVFRTSGVAGRSERLEQKDEVTKFAIHSEGPQSTFWRAMASELCVVLQNESIVLGPACVCCVVSVFATQRSVLAVSC